MRISSAFFFQRYVGAELGLFPRLLNIVDLSGAVSKPVTALKVMVFDHMAPRDVYLPKSFDFTASILVCSYGIFLESYNTPPFDSSHIWHSWHDVVNSSSPQMSSPTPVRAVTIPQTGGSQLFLQQVYWALAV
jgi:hypothetical protein